MNLKHVVGALVGIVLAMPGLLWFLQGTGLLRLCPALCFADCECVEGGSQVWEVAGAVTFAIGAILVWVSLRPGIG